MNFSYSLVSILSIVLCVLVSTFSSSAQVDPPQRGNRYLPGEAYRGTCFVMPHSSQCLLFILAIDPKCGMPSTGSVYPATKDTNSFLFRFSGFIPVFPNCPELEMIKAEIRPPSSQFSCSGAIPEGSSIPIVPFDSITMTYPKNPYSYIELRRDTSFYWFKTHKAQEFQFQLSTNKDFVSSIKKDEVFSNGIIVDTIVSKDFISLPLYNFLKKNNQYYWRVRPKKNNQWLEWSAYTQFLAQSTIQTGIYDEQRASKLFSFVENNVLTLTDATDHVNMDKLRISLVSLHGTITEVPSSNFSFNDSDIVINIESLTTGWYTLVLTDNTKTRVTTFIKQ